MALQHHQTQYEKIPDAITQSAKVTLQELRDTADAILQASAESKKADLAQAVASAATEVAQRTARTQEYKWATIWILVLSIVLGGGALLLNKQAHESGLILGYSQGYGEAKDEKAAAAWANTPEGKLAYRLAQKGDIRRLARCEGEGWQIKNGVCFPHKAPNGMVYGWAMP